MRGNVLTSGLLAVVVVAASGHAERLYDQDGIRRHGTLRLVGRNAATCNVLAAQHPEEVYEQMRANQDQPLHLWQVDLSVTNGSGRVLTYLRASVDIDSEWPPCTNWEGSSDSYRPGAHWTGYGWLAQRHHDMQAGEEERVTQYLVVFHDQQPTVGHWKIDYTFAAAAGAATQAAPAHSRPVPPCADQTERMACWMELANQAGCYVWNPDRSTATRVTWTGECANGRAHGTGSLTWVSGENERSTDTGRLQAGKPHGPWVIRRTGGWVSEGPGPWIPAGCQPRVRADGGGERGGAPRGMSARSEV